MSSLKILVADDSVTIQKVIRLALSHEGYEIRGVSHEKEFNEQLALFQPDVVIMDSTLSGKSAFEIKESLSQDTENKKIRFIFMSNTFEVIDDRKLAQSKFHGRLTKPFDPAQLRETIQSLFSEQPSQNEEDLKPFHEETIPDSEEWAISDSAKKGLLNNINDKEEEMHFETDDFSSLESHSISQIPQKLIHSEIDFDIELNLEKEHSQLFNRPQSSSSHHEEVQSLNEKEVKAYLEDETRKLIQKMLPDIAEKILKEEISKLLEAPPSR